VRRASQFARWAGRRAGGLSRKPLAYRWPRVIDLHCHVLPGIDDGPATIEGSVDLARAAAAAGIDTIVATPHVSRRYPNEAIEIARVVQELNGRLADEAIAVEIHGGAEVAIARLQELTPAELVALRLGRGPWLLVEPSFTRPASGLEAVMADLQRAGHRVVLAHPERCTAFHRDPLLLESLVHAGALTSITAGSLVGRFGDHVRRFALRLAADGLIHNVASDAHDHLNRPPGIADELQRVGLEALTDWLTRAVPAAILDGEQIPPRPADVVVRVADERKRWWRATRLSAGARRR
jgi:protein-tyrosine phosphatase